MRPGMHAGAVPGRSVDLGRGLPGRAVRAVVPVARGDGRGDQHRLLEPRHGRAQERPRVGADRQLGRGRVADGALAGLEVHVHPALARRRQRVARVVDLAQPGADDEQGVGRPEPLADDPGAP